MFHPVHRSSALLRVLVVIFIALLPSLAHAQTLVDWSALPSCASNCEPFFKAQDGCLPSGGAPVSNQQTYVSCFCQSAMLTNFRAGSGIECTGACPSVNDQTAIQQWYVNFCKSGGGVNTQASSATSSSTTTSSTAPTSSAPDSTATRNSNSVINDYDGDGDPSNNYEGSWISAHWKWVLMLIIIFFAMVFFSIFGMWLKRRHRKKQDAKRANLSGGEAGSGSHNHHPNNPNNNTGAGAAVPPPPPMAHLKNANDSGTLASTLDLPNNTTIAPTSPLRPRSRTNTLTRFPNGSMSNVGNGGNGQQQGQQGQQPVVWGPHQHQAATRGYEYHGIHHQMSGSPGPSVPPSPVSVPTPSLTPVGGFSMNNSNNSNNRFSGGSKDNVKSMSRDVVIDEVADEDRIEPAVGAEREGRLRRKLSRR
ncbi:hypothetical protein DBV05_g9949 [Lasiodiplodia theobromae]|uniref:Integral membrane protein n=1 Tax=Lasiodiplodia theobromae TaxID=45133 RepID=A0A5N5D1E1_9PEZI|nr:hypothetical protein DBV05_g9949 [Lasiodiplodia theobromae]